MARAGSGRAAGWPLLLLLGLTTVGSAAAVQHAVAGAGAPSGRQQVGTTTSTGAPTTTTSTVEAPGPRSTGELLFLRDCAVCHGRDGRGTFRGPTLEDVGTASVHFQLVTGRMPISDPGTGLMRPEPEYSPDQIEAIVEHLEPVVAGGPEVPTPDATADAAKGGELYRTHCAGCHGTAGVGGALVFAREPAPAVTGVSPVVTAEAMLVGPGTMPVFSPEPLGEQQTDEIVAYVDQVLSEPQDRGGWALWHLGPVPEGAVGWIVGLGALLGVARWLGTRAEATRDPEEELAEEQHEHGAGAGDDS